MTGRVTWPKRTICSTMPFTASIGNANPTPANAPLGDAMAVFTPTSDPLLSSNGPPEFPGLMAASVWMTPAMGRPVAALAISRPTPDTTPVVSVWSRPNGLPIANTFCPTSMVLDRPSGNGRRRPLSSETSSTAMSLSSSHPSTFAVRSFGSAWNFTATSSAPRTTWKLVTMWPSSSHTNPDPAPMGISVASSAYGEARRSCLLVMNATEGVFFLNRDTVAVSSGSSAVRAPAGTAATAPTALAGSSAERLTSKPAAAATATRAAPANGAAESDGGSFEATRGARDAECVAVGSSRCAVPSRFEPEMDTDGTTTSPRDAARAVTRRASRDAARGRRHVGKICVGCVETVSREDGAARRGLPRGTPRGATRAFGTICAKETIMVFPRVTVRRVVNLARTRPRWKCLETRNNPSHNESFPETSNEARASR